MRGETAFRGAEMSSFRKIPQAVGLVLTSRLICRIYLLVKAHKPSMYKEIGLCIIIVVTLGMNLCVALLIMNSEHQPRASGICPLLIPHTAYHDAIHLNY